MDDENRPTHHWCPATLHCRHLPHTLPTAHSSLIWEAQQEPLLPYQQAKEQPLPLGNQHTELLTMPLILHPPILTSLFELRSQIKLRSNYTIAQFAHPYLCTWSNLEQFVQYYPPFHFSPLFTSLDCIYYCSPCLQANSCSHNSICTASNGLYSISTVDHMPLVHVIYT